MTWKSSAEIRVRFNTEKQAKSIFSALKPEVNKPPTSRSIVEVSIKGNVLILKIWAKDIIALRASFNSHIRFLKAWKNVIKLIKSEDF